MNKFYRMVFLFWRKSNHMEKTLILFLLFLSLFACKHEESRSTNTTSVTNTSVDDSHKTSDETTSSDSSASNANNVTSAIQYPKDAWISTNAPFLLKFEVNVSKKNIIKLFYDSGESYASYYEIDNAEEISAYTSFLGKDGKYALPLIGRSEGILYNYDEQATSPLPCSQKVIIGKLLESDDFHKFDLIARSDDHSSACEQYLEKLQTVNWSFSFKNIDISYYIPNLHKTNASSPDFIRVTVKAPNVLFHVNLQD